MPVDKEAIDDPQVESDESELDELDDDAVTEMVSEFAKSRREAEGESADDAETGEIPEDEAEESPWYTGEVSEQAARDYGFTEDDLNKFGSQDEFDRTKAFLDRQNQGFSQYLQSQQQPEQDKQEKPAQQPGAPKQWTAEEAEKVFGKFTAENGYDDEFVEFANIAKDLYAKQQQQEQFINWQQQQAVEKQINQWNQLIDDIDPDTFGKVFDDDMRQRTIKPEAQKARDELGLVAVSVAQSRASLGLAQLAPQDLFKQAYQIQFADKVRTRENESRAQKIKQQSAKRRPVGGPKHNKVIAATLRENTLDDEAENQSIMNDPDVKALLEKVQERNVG